ncbi:phage repressor protein [Vibrio fluvialis]
MGQGDEAGKLTMCFRRTFAVDTPKGIDQVVSDNPTYVSFEINHKNGRNFKIIDKAIAPVFKKIF